MKNEEDLIYRLWLNCMCEHDPREIHKNIKRFGSAKKIYESKLIFSFKKAKSKLTLGENDSLNAAKKILDDCDKNNIQIITIDDAEYPSRLKNTSYPPQILYVKGKLPDVDNLVALTVVGTRDCTTENRGFIYGLAKDLAECGVLIISGLAKGIDTAAHKGALAAGHQTIAVLSGGVDVIYPYENRKLYELIIKHGAVISEQPPGLIGKGAFYKDRNRIMSGLGIGALVGEADFQSGVVHTVNSAKDCNRDMFAVPGSPTLKGSELGNALIGDGAKLTSSAMDILEEYANRYPEFLENGINIKNHGVRIEFSEYLNSGQDFNTSNNPNKKDKRLKTQKTKKKIEIDIIEKVEETTQTSKIENISAKPKELEKTYEQFEGDKRIVLKYLYDNNGLSHIDEISRGCNLPTHLLNSTFLLLEMQGIVARQPGAMISLLK
ncbi:MAG: DNA-processing protein DprA [Oscillospiraceae bacterium]